MASPGMLDATPLVLLSAVTVTATGFSTTFSLPEAESYALTINVTAATGTSPSDNIVLQYALDGSYGPAGTVTNPQFPPSVWVNSGIAFGSITATGSQTLLFKPSMGIGEAASIVAVTPGTASAKNGPIRRQFLRLSHTVTGTTPSITFTLYALANPKGYSVV